MADDTTELNTGDRWARVTALVDGALRRPDRRERSRYLRAACAGDDALRREVEGLLAFEEAESGVLGGALPGVVRAKTVAEIRQPGLRLGQRIGPYQVERLLGEGGMGAVAQAYDKTLDRTVAVKVLRRELASPSFLTRFENERRILARLDHPCIARLLDAGSENGTPWFTMELVKGAPIDVYCDQQQRSIEARLRLTILVCDALDEAHRNLVVHRDLKASNILVNRAGEPKLLDFGIAKELDTTHGTSVTRTGRLPLTPSHASPEQMRGLPVGVASDVYSLGVVLYRLLCGHPPYDLDGDGFENLRTVCERIPPVASARVMVSCDVWQDGVPTMVSPAAAASARGTTPQALRRRLSGDIDAILAKALAKAPEDRYRTIEQLSADLARHLRSEPVLARAGSVRYQMGRFVRRQRRALAAGGLLLVGITAAASSWHTSRVAEDRAAEAETQAEAWETFASSVVKATSPDVAGGQPLRAQDLLAHSLETARSGPSDRPEILGPQLEALGLAYLRLGDLTPATALLEESLALRREVYRDDHRLIARGLNNLAAAWHDAGDRSKAEHLYREALAMKRRLEQSPEDLTRVESNLASLLTFRGELDEAEERYRHILSVRFATSPDDPDIARTLRALGNVLYLNGDLPEAEIVVREALVLLERTQPRPTTLTASVLSTLGRVLHAQLRLEAAKGAFAETQAIREELLGPDHWHVALTLKDLSAVYTDLGDVEFARFLWSRARRILETRLPAGSWQLADADSQLGARLAARGEFARAAPCLQQGYETLRRVRGESSIVTRRARERLEALSQELGRFDGLRGTSSPANQEAP